MSRDWYIVLSIVIKLNPIVCKYFAAISLFETAPALVLSAFPTIFQYRQFVRRNRFKENSLVLILVLILLQSSFDIFYPTQILPLRVAKTQFGISRKQVVFRYMQSEFCVTIFFNKAVDSLSLFSANKNEILVDDLKSVIRRIQTDFKWVNRDSKRANCWKLMTYRSS